MQFNFCKGVGRARQEASLWRFLLQNHMLQNIECAPSSPHTCLSSPLLVRIGVTRQAPVSCLTDAYRRCQTSLGNLLFSLLSHKFSFSLSSEYESKLLAPLSTACSAIHFKEKSWMNVILCLTSEQQC